ncbi:hypothetical protein QOT17_016166 [Balamuthia mandrillaris]
MQYLLGQSCWTRAMWVQLPILLVSIGLRLAPAAHAEWEALKQLHVPIERWFGQQQCLWHLICGPYCWDHVHLDDDFEICALFTNKHIRRLDLQEQDCEFYKKLVHHHFLAAQAKLEKCRAQLKAASQRKKACLYPETHPINHNSAETLSLVQCLLVV